MIVCLVAPAREHSVRFLSGGFFRLVVFLREMYLLHCGIRSCARAVLCASACKNCENLGVGGKVRRAFTRRPFGVRVTWNPEADAG